MIRDNHIDTVLLRRHKSNPPLSMILLKPQPFHCQQKKKKGLEEGLFSSHKYSLLTTLVIRHTRVVVFLFLCDFFLSICLSVSLWQLKVDYEMNHIRNIHRNLRLAQLSKHNIKNDYCFKNDWVYKKIQANELDT